jgi:hypothetical protein
MAVVNYQLIGHPSLDLGTAIAQAADAREKRAKAQETENTNPYAARNAYAKAQSELTYANLMGPQYMAKLLENDPAFASLFGCQIGIRRC